MFMLHHHLLVTLLMSQLKDGVSLKKNIFLILTCNFQLMQSIHVRCWLIAYDMHVKLYNTNIRVKGYYLQIIFHLLDVCHQCMVFLWETLQAMDILQGRYGTCSSHVWRICVRKHTDHRPANSPTSSPAKKGRLSAARTVGDAWFGPLAQSQNSYSRIVLRQIFKNNVLCISKGKNCFSSFYIKWW